MINFIFCPRLLFCPIYNDPKPQPQDPKSPKTDLNPKTPNPSTQKTPTPKRQARTIKQNICRQNEKWG